MEPSVTQLPGGTEFHSASAANPTPSHAPNTNGGNHPPYADMITAAISALKEKGGSSKKAIAKYIDRVYTNLPASHSALLTHHLKRLKSVGQLVMVKKSYMLPRSAEGIALDPSPSLPKRGPGRPPKPKAAAEAAFLQSVQPNSVGLVVDTGFGTGPTLPKKRPGRPPKPKPAPLAAAVVPLYPEVQPQQDPSLVGSGLVNGSVIPKRRGRPPKSKVAGAVGSDTSGGTMLAQRSPGGLPPNAQPAMITPRSRGRPKKAKLPFAAPMMPSSRPRGRPPKKAKIAAGGLPGVLGVVGRKRRGRPPKIGGLQAPRRSAGRPMGRAKKSTETARKRSSGVAEGLMRKLEFMQACIKSAVSVLKPYVTNENAVDAVTALQRLDELVTMNISPAPEVIVPAPAPEPEPAPAAGPEPPPAQALMPAPQQAPAVAVAPIPPVNVSVLPPSVEHQQLSFLS
ncbi:hypothetical protein Ancab_036148 [Ancistrocladus abbreviatus]